MTKYVKTESGYQTQEKLIFHLELESLDDNVIWNIMIDIFGSSLRFATKLMCGLNVEFFVMQSFILQVKKI